MLVTYQFSVMHWSVGNVTFKIFVLHRGEMNETDQLSEEVYNNSGIGVGGHMNTVVYRIDLNDEKQATGFYDAHKDLRIKVGDQPEIILLYPSSTRVLKPFGMVFKSRECR